MKICTVLTVSVAILLRKVNKISTVDDICRNTRDCVEVSFHRNFIIYVIVLTFAFLPSPSALAQGEVYESETGYDPVVMPDQLGISIVIDNNEDAPVEPALAEIKFLKMPALNNIKERTDRLIWGVRKDIKPEYDHYGYEIRRYMAGTSNTKIFTNEEYLIEQIRSVRKARIIANYWADKVEDEVRLIEKEMKSRQGSEVEFTVKTAFKQNKLTVRKFIISLKSWIDANEKYLMIIFDNPDVYSVRYPEIMVSVSEVRLNLYNALVIKQTKLKEIRNYKTFEMMVH